MQTNHRNQRKGQRGFVLVLYTLMMLFIIIPMVGLAIDAGVLYTVKAKLQAAVDGAALGAARSLNRGQDITSQQSAANDTASRYYHANFPNNWMGVTPINDPTITWPTAPPATAIIHVQGDVNAPTWFMKILGFNSVHLTAIGEATRRNVDIMIVLDRSSSLTQPTNECPSLISGAQIFVNSFSNNRDIIGLLTFGTYYHVDFAPVTDFQDNAHSGANSLATVVLPRLVCQGLTNGGAAFSQAYSTLKGLGDHNALNVILFFTDGQPNTITFGPAYGTGTGPQLVKKSGSTCVLTSGATGFSGVLAGDVAYTIWGGVLRATNTAYPVASGGDFSSSFIIGTAENRSSGCGFATVTSGSGTPNFANDIVSLPATDSWGNAVNSTWSGGNTDGYPQSVTLTGSSWYSLSNLEHAGMNILDNAAANARADANANNIPFKIYTIGLGTVDNTLLMRVANDPGGHDGLAVNNAFQGSPYNQGLYINSPTAASLTNAFQSIADDIMRLSK